MTADSEVLPRFRAATSERRAYDFRTSTTKRSSENKEDAHVLNTSTTKLQHYKKEEAEWARGSICDGAL